MSNKDSEDIYGVLFEILYYVKAIGGNLLIIIALLIVLIINTCD